MAMLKATWHGASDRFACRSARVRKRQLDDVADKLSDVVLDRLASTYLLPAIYLLATMVPICRLLQ
eukprot:scaffold2263_cov76-Skeletonema_dohrnii-CCMP3373.AAC.6